MIPPSIPHKHQAATGRADVPVGNSVEANIPVGKNTEADEDVGTPSS